MKPYKHYLEYYVLNDIRDDLFMKYGQDIYAWGDYSIEDWYKMEMHSQSIETPYVVISKEFVDGCYYYFMPSEREIFSLIIKEYGGQNNKVVIKFL